MEKGKGEEGGGIKGASVLSTATMVASTPMSARAATKELNRKGREEEKQEKVVVGVVVVVVIVMVLVTEGDEEEEKEEGEEKTISHLFLAMPMATAGVTVMAAAVAAVAAVMEVNTG